LRLPSIFAFALLTAMLGPPSAAAQTAGQAFDWPILRKGKLEIHGATEFSSWTQRYGRRLEGNNLLEETEPLGFDLTDASESSRLFPGERELRAALEGTGFRLNLGIGETVAEAGTIRLPIRAALGVTNWLTIGVTVPFVRRLISVTQGASPDSASAGMSPTITDPASVETFLGEFGTAVQQGQAAADALCASVGESDPACVSARASLDYADVLFDALAVSYTGSPVFALEGSLAGDSLLARMEGVRSALANLGVTGFTAPLPLSTTAPTDLYRERLLQEPASGIATIHGEGWYNTYELGDVEITADLRLLDHQAVDATTGDPRWHFRMAVGGVFRLGTGVSDAPDFAADLGSISGQSDMEGRVFADVGIGDWLGVSSDVRYGLRGSGSGTLGWPPPLTLVNTPLASAPITWEPGNYMSFRITPRLKITRGLNLVGEYSSMTADPGTYTLDDDTAPIIPGSSARYPLPELSFLDEKSGGSVRRAGFGFTYSTLYRVAERGSGLPVVLRGRAEKAIGGDGGLTPKTVRFTAELRLFWQLWGD
jgi:hypothetical protein